MNARGIATGIAAPTKIGQFWESSDNINRRGIAHNLLAETGYDWDTQHMIRFRR